MKPNDDRRVSPAEAETAAAPEAALNDAEAEGSDPREPEGPSPDAEKKPYTGPERRAQGILIAEVIPPPDPLHPG